MNNWDLALESGMIEVKDNKPCYSVYFTARVILDESIDNVILFLEKALSSEFNILSIVLDNINPTTMLDMKTLLLLAGYIAKKYNKYKLLLHLDKTNLFSNNLLLDFKLAQWGELCRERRVYQSELSEDKKKRPVRREEKIVNELINIEQLKCQTEVITPHGRIDILTDDEIIEVKQFNKYKDAIGQMIAYSPYYPDRKKRIHLFGKGTEQQLTEIKSLTDPLNIVITTHN